MLDRRDFLKGTLTGTMAMGVAGCDAGAYRDTSGSDARGPTVASFELDEVTLQDLQASMESGERSARSITQLYLERIEELDGRGPTLRSIIEVNPEALDIADQLDAERRASGPRGPLHGIPVLLKDNIDTADRMTTTAGSLALQGSIPSRDAPVAARLRAAGAVLLAKANMSEWANFRGARSSSGWSARGGQCLNPYGLNRTPCGSSSGSAAAVAANLAPVAIGTETDGSIVCPSAITGIVGIKPTVGLWSRTGVIPISHSQDTAGPMTRTVRDAAVLLGVATGVDAADPATAASEGNAHSDYTQFLDPAGLRGARVGVARNFTGFPNAVIALLDQAAQAMRDQGAVIVDPADVRQLSSEESDQELLVLDYEFKDGINKYLATLGPGSAMKTLDDLIAFNEANAVTELAFFGQERFTSAAAKGPLTDAAYLDAARTIQRLTREEGIDAVMAEHDLQAVVVPTTGPAWLIDHVLGDRFDAGFSTSHAAIAGYPSITLPMGFTGGLPVGLTFMGRRWSEPVLLRLAYAFEQATQHRLPPTFPSVVI
jgi:amidase